MKSLFGEMVKYSGNSARRIHFENSDKFNLYKIRYLDHIEHINFTYFTVIEEDVEQRIGKEINEEED